MQLNRQVSSRNYEDPIAVQKRREDDGSGIRSALLFGGTVLGFIALRRKVQLTRSFSEELKTLGKAIKNQAVGKGVSREYGDYIVKTTIPEISGQLKVLKKSPLIIKRWGEEIFKPLPSALEQYKIALWRADKMFKRQRGVIGLSGSLHLENFPKFEDTGLSKWTRLDTLIHGPAATVVAPKVQLDYLKTLTSGAHGGVYIGGSLHRITPKGNVHQKVFTGIKMGLSESSGSRIDAARKGLYNPEHYKTLDEYLEKVTLPSKRVLMDEEKRRVLEKYFTKQSGKGLAPGMSLSELIESYEEFRLNTPRGKSLISPWTLFKDKDNAIQDAYQKTLSKLVETESKKTVNKLGYGLYNLQMKFGVGEPFMRQGTGAPQAIVRGMQEILGIGVKHPESGRLFTPQARRYTREGISLGGFINNKKSQYYPYLAGKSHLRVPLHLAEGTFFSVAEDFMGFGISSKPGKISNFVNQMLKIQQGTYADYAVRGVAGRTAKLVLGGMGLYHGYNFVNYLARQATGGWGPTDIAAKAYTSGRELQQNTLNMLKITDASRETEKAFPGIINSPLARFARISAPFSFAAIGRYGLGPSKGLSMFGKQIIPPFKLTKPYGVGGAKVGLAFGLALALITWGDITQSPEELHRIYTGEQDIPIRKGRYWMFGKQPFFGGKISYWRPHWSALLRSKYKYKGQLWDSESEYWAQGSPLAPILAPIMTGKLWDPYYWERRHYQDRPFPLTGELFEPTMPFAPTLNATIGEIIKPQRPMHPEYFGSSQQFEAPSKDLITGASKWLGVGNLNPNMGLPVVSPTDINWKSSQELYSLTERMGLRGYLLNTLVNDVTGSPDFLPQGPIIQSARRATGYERSYWDMDLGDIFGSTEFFRRILPHRRRGIEEYNPIPNTMPDWLPGAEYYNNFRQGDPYTKIEMGEARLPGPGYESLHRLHSGIPEVYDAVDRFLILSDVAPYSNQYKHYKYLAQSMTRNDEQWMGIVDKHIKQRADTQKEFDFLELEPPEDVHPALRGLSKIYRHSIAAITNFPNPAAVIPFTTTFTADKLFPYKTARSTYEDYRLYGSQFASWGHWWSDFAVPYGNKLKGWTASKFGMFYIPPEEKERREYEDYFDKLKYVKNKYLASIASSQNNDILASQFKSMASKTMTGSNVYNPYPYSTMPARERSFFDSFKNVKKQERDDILSMIPRHMHKLYQTQWNQLDKSNNIEPSYDVPRTTSNDLVDYFKDYHLPESSWLGWHPDVDLSDVQLSVVKNEGMDIHDFNLWESREREMRRRPYVPDIGNIKSDTTDLSVLQNILTEELNNQSFKNVRVNVYRTPSIINRIKMNLNIKKDNREKYNNTRDLLYA